MSKRCTRSNAEESNKSEEKVIWQEMVEKDRGCKITTAGNKVRIYGHNLSGLGWWISTEAAKKIAIGMLDTIGYETFLQEKNKPYRPQVIKKEFNDLPMGEILGNEVFDGDNDVGWSIYRDSTLGHVIRVFGRNVPNDGWGFSFGDWIGHIAMVLEKLGYKIFHKSQAEKSK